MEEKDLDTIMKERFAKLPSVVQEAITGAGVEKHLRMLSNKHKLHLDQWQVLENEVIMTLMGMQPAEELEDNIEKEVGVERELAREIANDIALEVFDPIRKEMERQLEHPDAQEKETEPIEDMRSEILSKANMASPISEPEEDLLETDIKTIENSSLDEISNQNPAKDNSSSKTVPEINPEQETKIKRTPVSGEYVPGIISSERREIKDDPYRESPDE